MEISFGKIFLTIFKHLFAIAVCGIIGLVLAFSTTKLFFKPTYESYVKMWVELNRENPTSQELLADTNLFIKKITSYLEILKSESFYSDVAEQSTLKYSTEQLRSMLQYNYEAGTQVFTIVCDATNPIDAKKLADTAASLAPFHLKESVLEDIAVKALGEANLATKPISSKTLINSILGLIGGILVSILFFIIREILNMTIQGENDLINIYNIPMLGSIPQYNTSTFVKQK